MHAAIGLSEVHPASVGHQGHAAMVHVHLAHFTHTHTHREREESMQQSALALVSPRPLSADNQPTLGPAHSLEHFFPCLTRP